MESIVKKIGNAEFVFDVNSRDTRGGFAHDCELCAGLEVIGRATCHYLNRTWESYRYQTVMLAAVRDALNTAKSRIENAEKAARGWDRLTAARRDVIEKIMEQNSGVVALTALEDAVAHASYGTEEEGARLRSMDVLLAVLEALKPNSAKMSA